jgi:hypothetical protein
VNPFLYAIANFARELLQVVENNETAFARLRRRRRHLIAIPFRSLKLDDSSRDIMLPGVSRAALEKNGPFSSAAGEPAAWYPQAALTTRRTLPRISQ